MKKKKRAKLHDQPLPQGALGNAAWLGSLGDTALLLWKTGSDLGKECVKAAYCHPACLTYMQSTSCEVPGWMKYKIHPEVSICREKYQKPQICRWNHSYGRKWRGTKESLDESERGEWKNWLKTQHSKNYDHGIQAHHFMANRLGNSENSDRLSFLGLQNHCRWWL